MSDTAQSGAQPVVEKKTSAAVAPDERFWKRYSPHHEFSLSGATSVVLHVLAAGLLVLGIVLLTAGPAGKDRPLNVDVVQTTEPPGPGGVGPDPVGPGRPDDPVGIASPEGRVPVPAEPEKIAQAKPEFTISKPEQREKERLVTEGDKAGQDLGDIARKAQARIDGARRRNGQPGNPGGGRSGTLEDQIVRRNRWTMMFNTQSGKDYFKQLQDLKATLAIPQPDGRYLIIRSGQPEVRTIEDPAQFKEMFWMDDKPQSVNQLAEALGIRPVPSFVAAFFPQKLVDELLDKELTYLRKSKPTGKEADIGQTYFQLEWRGDRLEPFVHRQTLR